MVCPCRPLAGVIDSNFAEGLTVRVAEFELANETLAVVAPCTVTEYCVGLLMEIEAGIVKVTRRVDPTIVATADAAAATEAPPADGVSETVTAEG